MSGLILCRSKVAENPYYIKNMDLRIYSLEELCYYIYNNIYLIGMDLVDDRLVDFIRYEVAELELAEKLEYLMKQKAGLAEIVVTILKYVDYYSYAEIEELREILETLNSQNVFERLKARADSFLSNQCFHSAIKNYTYIIDCKKDSTLPGIFYAKVYHNMGVAFAKLYLFQQAMEYFDMAYKIGQHEESLKALMAAEILALGNEVNDESKLNNKNNENNGNDENQNGVVSEEFYVLNREIETLMDNACYSQDYKKLEHMQLLKNEGLVSQYYKLMDEIIGDWKRQYKRFTT